MMSWSVVKKVKKDELTRLLNQMENSYFDFIDSVLDYSSRKPERLEKVLNFI